METRPTADAVELRAEAGEPWDALVQLAVDQGWAGVECLSGIPGLVGATPIQNVGAYGQDVAETVVRASRRWISGRVGSSGSRTRNAGSPIATAASSRRTRTASSCCA